MARSVNRSRDPGRRAPRRMADLEGIALLPEIAVARVGSSTEPLACYDWSKEPDTTPNGSGQMTVERKPTLRISETGHVEQYEPEHLEFTEQIENGRSQRFHPVCPWFVLFAKWRDDSDWHILSPQDLKDIGVPPTAVSWHVMVATRKAYNLTLAFEDIVYAEAMIGGAQRDRYGEAQRLAEQPLVGRSDLDYWTKYSEFRNTPIKPTTNQWLIPAREKGFHLGHIQAPVFSDKYGIRLRFIPPAGAVYGPTNLLQRIEALIAQMTDDDRKASFDPWKKLKILGNELKHKHCILNPKSAWALKRVSPEQEIRTLPGPQFANIELKQGLHSGANSLGLMDDFSDGIVTVTIAHTGGKPLKAQSRIVVGPPDLAPDRRHPITLYDTLDDRAYLADIDGANGYQGHPNRLRKDQWREEVLDLFRRAFGPRRSPMSMLWITGSASISQGQTICRGVEAHGPGRPSAHAHRTREASPPRVAGDARGHDARAENATATAAWSSSPDRPMTHRPIQSPARRERPGPEGEQLPPHGAGDARLAVRCDAFDQAADRGVAPLDRHAQPGQGVRSKRWSIQ